MFRVKYYTYLFALSLLAVAVLCFTSCKKIVEVEEPHGGFILETDTAFNNLRLECLNPSENRIFHAHQYTEKLAGFRDLFLSEYQLYDSIGNRNYKLRIYSHLIALKDTLYQTTDNNYNPFKDKVYIEFYKENGTNKDELYVSMINQKDNYFKKERDSLKHSVLSFQYLAKFSNPDRFAQIKGKFKVR